MTLRAELVKMAACKGAVDWVGEKPLAEAWATCERADWMLWFAERVCPRPLVVGAMVTTIRPVVLRVSDTPINRAALDAAERWADEPTAENQMAAAAAGAATWAADAAARAAAGAATWAADAAARAASWAASWAVWAAARAADAAWAATWAAAWAATWAAARAAAHREMCDRIRSVIPDIEKARGVK